jgi:hypothetical protein
VLAVSLERVRLLEGDGEACRAVALVHVPTSFEEALGELQYDSATQQHTGSSSRLGRRQAIVHGPGDRDAEHFEADLAQYFRVVARALERQFGRRTTPLVLAAVREYFPLLQQADLPWTVLEEGIPGSPDRTPDRELHANALRIVRDRERRELEATLARYGDLAAHDKASAELSTVLEAALAGRIHALLVGPEAQLWGRFDPAAPSLVVHAAREPGDEDLVALAVRETLRCRGLVWRTQPGDLPGEAPLAAIFRY